MTIPSIRRTRATIDVIVAMGLLGSIACGPGITVESGSDASEGSSSGSGPSTTTGPAPTTTPSSTTTSPPQTGVTTDPPLDTGEFDTGQPWLDLPEECSILAQDCPPGFKCMPYASDGGTSWNDTTCVPIVEDPNLPGEPCTVEGNGVSGIDDCDGTSMCWDVDPKTNEGTCVAHCIGDESDPTCLEPCFGCVIAAASPLALCLATCDPITQNCGVGEACYPVGSQLFACAPDASPEGAGIGTDCSFTNECPPGLVCIDPSIVPGCELAGVGCCAPVCPVGGADPCPGLLPGTECTPWFPEGPPEEVEGCVVAEPGVCVTP